MIGEAIVMSFSGQMRLLGGTDDKTIVINKD